MARTSSITTEQWTYTAPDFGAAFPSPDLVTTAAGMFTKHRQPERPDALVIAGPLAGHVAGNSIRKTLELFPETAASTVMDRLLVEGPRWYVTVTPGTVSVRRTDPARAVRAYERGLRAEEVASRLAAADVAAGRDPFREGTPGRCIRHWSSRSRARMVEVLGTLDYSPLFSTGETPAMVTLSYGDDWLTVAPCAAASRRHLMLLRKRFEREYGRRLLALWKREFQRRGAPHWHLLMVPPTTPGRSGLPFRRWLAETWSQVVGGQWCGRRCWESAACCERGRMVYAHLLPASVSYADGVKASNPRLVGVYFSKHGSFAAKDYQNTAPEEWAGSVGRFWGVWGLSSVRASVEVAPVEGLAVARTLRRHSRAAGRVARVPVWRYRTSVDPVTGEVTARWRKSSALRRVYRMQQSAGYVIHEDAPSLAGALAVHVDRLRRPESVVSRSGAGPLGFLP